MAQSAPAIFSCLTTDWKSSENSTPKTHGLPLAISLCASYAHSVSYHPPCIVTTGGHHGVDSTWRLVFGTSTKLRFLQYVPVDEFLEIDMKSGGLRVLTHMGPLSSTFQGEVLRSDSQHGVLDFQFTGVEIALGGKKVSQGLQAAVALAASCMATKVFHTFQEVSTCPEFARVPVHPNTYMT